MHPLQEIRKGRDAKAQPQVLRGRVLQVVPLVDDQRFAGGQDAAADGHIAQQERVIADDDVRTFGATASAQQETAAIAHVRAGSRRQAVLPFGTEVGPG